MVNPSREVLAALFCGSGSLTHRMTVEEAESAFAVLLEEYSPTPIPFGALNPQWNRLKAKMRDGDELWEFDDAWPAGGRAHGVKLLRSGKVVDSIVARITDPPKANPPVKPKRKTRK